MENVNLADYFSGKKKRLSYTDSSTNYQFLRFHFDGPEKWPNLNYSNGESTGYDNGQYNNHDFAMDAVFRVLVHNRRPSETIDIWQYRRQIFEPITKEPTSKVLRSLNKIKRSSDWSIEYERANIPSNIAENETPEKYFEYNYPHQYNSLTNWAFSVLLKNILIDPNAVCLILPLNKEPAANEYRKPFPVIFNSPDVFEYVPNEFAVLLTVEKTEKGGNVFLVVTPETVERWEQKNNSATDYENTDVYAHGLGYLPCFKLPGVFKKAYATDYLNDSHISSMLPRLNEAVREYSDMQAEVVQHVFSEKWEIASQKCEECFDPVLGNSTGFIKSGKGKTFVKCTKCNGTGLMGAAPYKKIQIRNNLKLDEQQVPIPPAGFIQKQIDIVKVQNERIEGHVYKALSAINMEFLANTPLNQSGTAKEVDRDELNNFIYSVAEDIVLSMDLIYKYSIDFRYREIVPGETQRAKLRPHVAVPQKYDLIYSGYLMDEFKQGRDAGMSDVVMQEYEINFCAKHFTENPLVRQEIELNYKLDPLPAKSEDEKLAIKTGGGCRELDYVISCNITHFVKRAISEDEKFYEKPLAEQTAVMEKFGQEVLSANSLKPKPQALALVPAGT